MLGFFMAVQGEGAQPLLLEGDGFFLFLQNGLQVGVEGAAANDWAGQLEDEEPQEITKEQFMGRMELESIEIRADGSFV